MKNNSYTHHKSRYAFRYWIAFASILIPVILLIRGLYGSFIFCFSIPLLWQVAYLGKPLSSLGLRKKSIPASLIAGFASGIVLGLLGGNALRLLGLTSHPFINADNLHIGIGIFKVEFSLARELGYRLLTMDHGFKGLAVYLLFSILLVGLGEEIFWRGFIQRKIATRVARTTSIWITATLFALMHFYIFLVLPFNKGLVFLALIGVAGMVWGFLYEKIGNIWSAAISHGIAAFIIWKYYFFLTF